MTEEIVKQVDLPVTVKTRLGWDHDSIKIVEVAQRLQDAGIKALTIHGRTRRQMYKGDADWSYIAKVKNHPEIRIPIFGNGDVTSPEKAMAYRNKYGVDGVMIGRASIGNPWIFREIKHFMKTGDLLPPPTLGERISTVKKHLEFSLKWKGERKGIFEMRRHYSNYFRGLNDFKPFRTRLVVADNPDELHSILDEIQTTFSFQVTSLNPRSVTKGINQNQHRDHVQVA